MHNNRAKAYSHTTYIHIYICFISVLDEKVFTCYEENDENYEEFLVKDSNQICEVFKTIIMSLVFESWQIYFEDKIMPSPDIYQAHYFGLRKADRKKVCVALSDKKMFVTDVKSNATPADTKDIVPYEFFVKLHVAEASLAVTIPTSIRTLPEVSFVLFDKEDFDAVVYKLQVLYFYDRKARLEKVVEKAPKK